MPRNAAGALRSRAQRGTTLLATTFIVTLVAAVAFAFSSQVYSYSSETRASLELAQADAAAEAAVNEAWGILEDRGLAELAAVSYPRTLRTATYDLRITDGDTDATLDPGLVRLTAVGRSGAQIGGAQIVVRRTASGAIGGEVFGRSKVHLETASKVDAYDSSLGSYASQAVNSYDGVTYADSDVGVATNADVETKTDSKIFGDAELGPSGWYIDDGTGHVSGSVSQATAERTLPTITVPSVATSGSLALTGSGTTSTIGPGTFGYDEIAVATEAELTIVGPAVIVTGSAKTETDGKVFVDTTNGPVDVYCTGVFQVKTDTLWKTLDDSAVGMTVHLPGVGDSHKIETGAVFTGTILAPDGEVVIETTGDVFGAVIADLVTMKTGAFVHVDKALGAPGGASADWELVAVNRISGDVALATVSAP